MTPRVRLLSIVLVALGATALVALAACTSGTTPDCSDAGACNVTGPTSDASTSDTGTADTGTSDASRDASGDAPVDAPSDAGRPADAGGQ